MTEDHSNNTNTQTENVEPELVPYFEKASRVIGLIVSILFIYWGLEYNWKFGDSPFEEFFEALGMRSSNSDEAAVTLGVFLFVIGWFLRFYIGVLCVTTFFKIWGLVKKLFKSI